jgi:type III secretion protein T
MKDLDIHLFQEIFFSDNEYVFFVFVLAYLRLYAFFTVSPILGLAMQHSLVKQGILISLSFFLLPSFYNIDTYNEIPSYSLLLLAFKEIGLGVCLAFLTSLVFLGIEMFSSLVNAQLGASLNEIANGKTNSSPLGVTISQLYIVYLFSGGGFFLILSVLYQSYFLWPVLAPLPDIDHSNAIAIIINTVSLLFKIMISFAGPFIIAFLITDIITSIWGKYAPQTNILILSLPVKVLLFSILIYLEIIILYKSFDIYSYLIADTLDTFKKVFL